MQRGGGGGGGGAGAAREAPARHPRQRRALRRRRRRGGCRPPSRAASPSPPPGTRIGRWEGWGRSAPGSAPPPPHLVSRASVGSGDAQLSKVNAPRRHKSLHPPLMQHPGGQPPMCTTRHGGWRQLWRRFGQLCSCSADYWRGCSRVGSLAAAPRPIPIAAWAVGGAHREIGVGGRRAVALHVDEPGGRRLGPHPQRLPQVAGHHPRLGRLHLRTRGQPRLTTQRAPSVCASCSAPPCCQC